MQHGAGEDNLVHSLGLQGDFCGEDTQRFASMPKAFSTTLRALESL